MIFYALSVAFILAGCFAFYKILLQQETFFPLNRFILLGCLVLSFSLPLIPVPEQLSFRTTAASQKNEMKEVHRTAIATSDAPNTLSKQVDQNADKVESSMQEEAEKPTFFKDISLLKVVLWTYWLGVVVFGLNFLVQLLVLLYRVYSRPFIQDGRFRIVEVSGDQAPCSFANNIFINPEKYDWETYSQIILHEKIHIQQGHSYDIIFAELALIFQWFNPFAWLYRKAMEDNLEFLTDSELLQHSDIEPTSYQMSLVKVSAPNFPASLTTNYNQSILKRRLIMMNAKKSNINSTWKYLCIVPLLLLFVSLLNEPVAFGKARVAKTMSNKIINMTSKGNWFATIKGDQLQIRFEDENDKNSYSNRDFQLAEFSPLPKDQKGDFYLSRDAGRMNFSGRFEGSTGMGTYEFVASESFVSFLQNEEINMDKDKNLLVFFLVNVNKAFITSLKKLNYTNISKNDLIPLAALNVTAAYIKSLMNAGLQNLSLQDVIPLKALGVDANYVSDIKKSGYKDVTAQKLIMLKSQGIDGEFIKSAKNANKQENVNHDSSTYPISTKTNKKTNHQVKGEDDDDAAFGLMIAKKVLNVSSEYAKSFSATGLKMNDETLLAFKALGITAEYVKSFESLGLSLSEDDISGMKATGLTAADYKAYGQLGFKDLNMGDIIGAKATGTTPAFIATMKKKGYNYNKIDKYISMKVTAAGDQ